MTKPALTPAARRTLEDVLRNGPLPTSRAPRPGHAVSGASAMALLNRGFLEYVWPEGRTHQYLVGITDAGRAALQGETP